MALSMLLALLTLLFVVFIAAMWNAGQAALESGPTRAKHLAIVTLTILLMAGLGLGAPEPIIQVIGAGLALSAVSLAWEARGRGRLYCLVQFGFGGIAALGLPYAVA